MPFETAPHLGTAPVAATRRSGAPSCPPALHARDRQWPASSAKRSPRRSRRRACRRQSCSRPAGPWPAQSTSSARWARQRFYVCPPALHRRRHADRHGATDLARAAHDGQGHGRPASLPAERREREQLWLANGEAAGSAALRLPLDVINVSSGFGLRADPLDKPGPAMGPLNDPAPVAAAPAPEPPPPPRRSLCRRRAGRAGRPTPPSAARATCSTPAVRSSIAAARARASARGGQGADRRRSRRPPPPPPKPRLFMHDGLDLVAVTGTETMRRPTVS